MPTALPKYGTSDSGNKNLLESAQANGEVSQNTLNKLIVAFAGTGNVVSELSTPPGSPNEIDMYLVGSSPTGDWSTFDQGDLAIYIDSDWYELDPFEGLKIYRADTDGTYTYDGSNWVEGLSSVSSGITASTNQTQGQEALTARVNHVGTVGTTNDVVTLPAALAGLEVSVINAGANTLQVYPASGDDIDGGATDASTTLAAGVIGRFHAIDGDSWFLLSA